MNNYYISPMFLPFCVACYNTHTRSFSDLWAPPPTLSSPGYNYYKTCVDAYLRDSLGSIC